MMKKPTSESGAEMADRSKLWKMPEVFFANGVSVEIIAKSLHRTEDQVREIVNAPVPVKA